jgi:hypothetical protein
VLFCKNAIKIFIKAKLSQSKILLKGKLRQLKIEFNSNFNNDLRIVDRKSLYL